MEYDIHNSLFPPLHLLLSLFFLSLALDDFRCTCSAASTAMTDSAEQQNRLHTSVMPHAMMMRLTN